MLVSVFVQTVCMHNIRTYVQVYSTCSQGFRGCDFTVEGSSVLLKLLPYECSICIYNVAQSGMTAQCHIFLCGIAHSIYVLYNSHAYTVHMYCIRMYLIKYILRTHATVLVCIYSV